MSKPRKIVTRMQQSLPARCERPIGMLANQMVLYCGSPLEIIIKKPKVWSYQERVSERCTAGHIVHAQAVVEVEDDSEDCWGAF